MSEAFTMWFWPMLQGFETGQYPSGCRRSLQAGRLWDVQGRDSEWCDDHHVLWDSWLHRSWGKTVYKVCSSSCVIPVNWSHLVVLGGELWKIRMDPRKEGEKTCWWIHKEVVVKGGHTGELRVTGHSPNLVSPPHHCYSSIPSGATNETRTKRNLLTCITVFTSLYTE